MNTEDLFTVNALTEAVEKLPTAPGRLAPLFPDKGVKTTSIVIELQGGRLVLVPNTSRNAPGHAVEGGKRKTITLTATHLPLTGTILPEDIQDIRAFGKEATDSGLEAQATVINDKLTQLKQSIETTREYHRVGALAGKVLDADGTTVIYDLFNEFGVTPIANNVDFSNAATNILKAYLDTKRAIEKNANGIAITEVRALCGSEFFDAMVDHTKVRAAYAGWQAAADRMGGDMRHGFTFGGITFEEYAGGVGGIPFIPDDVALVYPVAANAFVTYNAPANYNEAVNTLGQAWYAKSEPRRMGKGWDIEVQSNPITLCLWPECLARLSAA
ncbi:MAG: major capsid protein [Betaproteobacteria bacterium]|nr:major capsid protein [Betaproteobacteria bacterium]